MNSNSVHLIATDPPFNKGRDFHATPDSLASGASFHDRWSWKKDVHQEWTDQITDDWPHVMHVIEGSRMSYGDDMGAFLCYMAVRLIAMHRVLRNDGSIYLHCDPTASHYLKELMDAIFGKKNFQNEIIWYYKNASRGKKRLAKSHDVIFWYSKTKEFVFNRDEILVPFESGMTEWRYKRGGQAGKEMPKGKTPDDVIIMPSLNAMDKERTGYPTQKPLSLYERIVRACSNEGDIVLDPFSGCATTCVVAEILGRQWVGIDIWDKAHEVVVNRLEAEGLLGGHRLDSVHLTSEIPERTDGGETVVPFMLTPKGIDEPKGKKMSRAEMLDILLDKDGSVCQGCGREFDDKRYLQLDHNAPRSSGGINHISNRILLCGPCNLAKSDDLTLVGLRKYNRKNNFIVNENNLTR